MKKVFVNAEALLKELKAQKMDTQSDQTVTDSYRKGHRDSIQDLTEWVETHLVDPDQITMAVHGLRAEIARLRDAYRAKSNQSDFVGYSEAMGDIIRYFVNTLPTAFDGTPRATVEAERIQGEAQTNHFRAMAEGLREFTLKQQTDVLRKLNELQTVFGIHQKAASRIVASQGGAIATGYREAAGMAKDEVSILVFELSNQWGGTETAKEAF